MKKRFILPILLLMILNLLLVACSTPNESNENNENLAPMFELESLHGDKVSLKDYAGEKVYIKYWASWCSACLAGLEDINELSKQNSNFEVITIVNPQYKGEMTSEDFKKWFQSLAFDHTTVLLDENGVWAKQFGVLAYPSSYFIDSDGVLVKNVMGNQSNTDIKNEFKNIF